MPPSPLSSGTGKRIGDVGAAVQTHAEANGYGVVRADRTRIGKNSMKLLKYPTMPWKVLAW